MKSIGLLIVILVWLTSSGHVAAASSEDQALAAADNRFAFKLLKQLASEHPGSNIFVSPYGVSAVFQAVANGAVGQTRTEMQRILEIGYLAAPLVNHANQDINRLLNTSYTNVVITSANSVWYRQDAAVRPEFLAETRQNFGATVEPLDFKDPHAADVINAWAAAKTHGKIPEIADDINDLEKSGLYLANGIDFKGDWQIPFEGMNPRQYPFHLQGGGQEIVPMMGRTRDFKCLREPEFQAVRLAYDETNLAMYVFLPNFDSSVDKLLDRVTVGNWDQIIQSEFSWEIASVALPKFRLESNPQLKKTLSSMGMTTAFDETHADFSGISSGLWISDSRQKTFIDVQEDGTEAEAVTVSSVGTKGPAFLPGDGVFNFIADHPFLFVIEDQNTGVILFMGIVFDPANVTGS